MLPIISYPLISCITMHVFWNNKKSKQQNIYLYQTAIGNLIQQVSVLLTIFLQSVLINRHDTLIFDIRVKTFHLSLYLLPYLVNSYGDLVTIVTTSMPWLNNMVLYIIVKHKICQYLSEVFLDRAGPLPCVYW